MKKKKKKTTSFFFLFFFYSDDATAYYDYNARAGAYILNNNWITVARRFPKTPAIPSSQSIYIIYARARDGKALIILYYDNTRRALARVSSSPQVATMPTLQCVWRSFIYFPFHFSAKHSAL